METLPCDRCLGMRNDVSFSAYDFGPDAAWKESITSDLHYLRTHVGSRRSPWAIVRGWNQSRIRDDLLRNMYLGLGKDAGGQCIFDLAKSRGGPLDDALNYYGKRCKQHYKEKGRPIEGMKNWSAKYLGLGEKNNEYPILNSRIKAATTKKFLFGHL